MSAQRPLSIIVVGGSGDLARRKLLPALYNLRGHGLMPKEFAILGLGRRQTDDAGLRELQARLFSRRPQGPRSGEE